MKAFIKANDEFVTIPKGADSDSAIVILDELGEVISVQTYTVTFEIYARADRTGTPVVSIICPARTSVIDHTAASLTVDDTDITDLTPGRNYYGWVVLTQGANVIRCDNRFHVGIR